MEMGVAEQSVIVTKTSIEQLLHRLMHGDPHKLFTVHSNMNLGLGLSI